MFNVGRVIEVYGDVENGSETSCDSSHSPLEAFSPGDGFDNEEQLQPRRQQDDTANLGNERNEMAANSNFRPVGARRSTEFRGNKFGSVHIDVPFGDEQLRKKSRGLGMNIIFCCMCLGLVIAANIVIIMNPFETSGQAARDPIGDNDTGSTPSNQTLAPAASSTLFPSLQPTSGPTMAPTGAPPNNPSNSPTSAPMIGSTTGPTNTPTSSPMVVAIASPTGAPTKSPTSSPSLPPLAQPTLAPTNSPTTEPTLSPRNQLTDAPTTDPTDAPSHLPTEMPVNSLTNTPTRVPTGLIPTSFPTDDDDDDDKDFYFIK